MLIIFYRYLTLFVLAILPLFPNQLDIRISYLIYIYAILLLPVFFKPFWSRVKSKDPITIAWVLFLLSASASTYFSIDQQRSLLILGIYLSTFIIFISASIIFPKLKDKEKLALVLVLVTCALSPISLYNTLFRNYVNTDRIGVSFMWVYFGHNHLSSLLLFAIPLSFYFLITKWNNIFLRLVFIVSCILYLVSFYFTFSRGAIIAFLLSILITLGLFKLVSKRVLLLIFVLCTLSLWVFLSTLKSNGKIFNVARNEFSDNSRLTYWQKGIENGLNHPFFGTGLDTARYITYPKKTTKTDYSHNFFIQMFSDGGWLGLVSGISLIVVVFYQIIKLIRKDPVKNSLRIFLFTAFLSSLLLSLLDFDWQLPTIFLIFWTITSLLPENPAN